MFESIHESNLFILIPLLVVFTGVVLHGCANEIPCGDLEGEQECLAQSGCFFRSADEACVADDGSDGPLCEERLLCSGSDDYDLCEAGVNCCVLEFSEVDLNAIGDSTDSCGLYTSRVKVCAPKKVDYRDSFDEVRRFVFEDSEGQERMLLAKYPITNFEEIEFQPCLRASEEYEEICASCEYP